MLKVFLIGLLGVLSVVCGLEPDASKPICKPKPQSPIALYRQNATLNNKLQLNFSSNYDKPQLETAINIGVTIQIRSTSTGAQRRYVVTETKKKFFLDSVFIRWPSEHTIDGQRYPLEVQIVHKREDFKDLGEAAKVNEGVLVISVLHKVSPNANPVFDSLLKVVPSISKNVMKPVNFTGNAGKGVPKNASFYRYDGSISIPKCPENSIYNVVAKISTISKPQLTALTNIYNKDGKKVLKNNRDLQPLGKRKVYFKQQ